MTVLFGMFFGCFIGFLFIKSIMEKRLYLILTKSGLFKDEQVNVLMSYYKNYNKIQKQVVKSHKEQAQRMELNYQLKKVQPVKILNESATHSSEDNTDE